MLCLLDLSTAFGTLKHTVLIEGSSDFKIKSMNGFSHSYPIIEYQ